MITAPTITCRLEQTSRWLIAFALPLGWIALLTGMLWIGERPLYHKLFYALLAAPTLLALLLAPRQLKALLRSPLTLAFLAFATYMTTTLLWSETDNALGSLAKRPIYVLFLFFSAGAIALQAPEQLWRVVKASAMIASAAALLSCYLLFRDGAPERFAGYGALDNPLLSSHVYGFFFVLWASLWFLQKNCLNPVPLLSAGAFGVLILATGSRTPLLAIAVSLLWLLIVNWNVRSLIAGAAGLLGVAGLLLLHPASLLNRGFSSRPEIWGKAWQQILEAPWFGHGYGAPMEIWIAAHDFAMADPHNLTLAVLYAGGVFGLMLWAILYTLSFRIAWQYRKQSLTMVVSALLVYGFVAGMTEGGAFLPRPKEHWFLVWIPMVLLAATHIVNKNQGQSHEAAVENA